jgi:hypothetical protein
LSEASEAAQDVLDSGVADYSDWVRVSCQFCVTRIGKDDHRKSFGVNSVTGFFHCFRCGIKGKIQSEEFDDGYSLETATQVAESNVIDKPYHYTPLWLEPGASAEALAPAREYMLSRGFGPKTWEAAQIGACYGGYFENRVVVPILGGDCGTQWLGFVARDWVGTAERKYLYPRGMNRSDILWQCHLLYIETDEPVLVVEGVFDALPYVGSAVACLGKPAKKHVEMIKQAQRPIAVVLDGDAWEEGYALSQVLRLNGNRAGYVKLPAGEDPASVDCGWLLQEAYDCVGS